MKKARFSILPLTMAALLVFANCGKDESRNADPAVSNSEPVIREGLSPEERAQFCFLRIAHETGTTLDEFIDQLRGTWVHFPAGQGDDRDRREFMLDPSRRIAAVTTYFGSWKNVADITYRQLCVSKPLDASHGAYSGYRIVEMLAANNEGAAAILVKFARADSSNQPKLLVSDYYYERHATNTLEDPAKVLGSSSASRIWSYPQRQ